MRAELDGMKLIRAELCERIEALQQLPARRKREFEASLSMIRQIASAYGLYPVARIAEAMERGSAPGADCPRRLYLDRLQDAIGCGRTDEEASQAMLASVSVRLCA